MDAILDFIALCILFVFFVGVRMREELILAELKRIHFLLGEIEITQRHILEHEKKLKELYERRLK